MPNAPFNLEDIKKRMDGAIAALKQEYTGLRTGRANIHLLDPIHVEAYGASTPLNQVGAVSAPEPRMLAVQVWDRGVVTAVEKATQEVVGVATDRFVFDSLDLARESIERVVRSLDPGVEYTVSAVEGFPARALINVATEVNADLIVVGNVRMQGISRVLGSVGNEVLHNAPCNVLIVKTV